MSQASHVVGRLRALYGFVLGRARRLGRRPVRPRGIPFWTPPGNTLEALEPRLLLSGETASSYGLYDINPSLVSPVWFQSLVTDAAPAGQATGTATSGASDAATGDQDARWIVQLTRTAIEGVSGIAGTVALFSGAPFGAEVVRGLGFAGQILLQTHGAAAEDVAAWLKGNAAVAYAEPDQIVGLLATPNDPSYSQLWGLNNTGQTGGTPDADIDAPEAWDIAHGNGTVVIGVIDTGVDWTHVDLAANIWTNPGEVAGNGIDDDGNGFIDDVHGYDFVNNDGNPMDDHYHGTHVSGTIAAVGNNGVGVVGVNWNAQIMGLKFLNSGGSGSTSDAIRAVNYATMMRGRGVNIRLTSNSWGGGGFDQGLQDAIQASGTAGLLFIAAAGNSGSNNDVTPNYPSNYPLANIIAVAATDSNGAKASFSSYGATTVDLGAPGVNIYSTAPGNSYRTLSGTSMATPHVAGVAALLWSTSPTATYQTIRDAIYNGVDPIPSMAGITVTGGRLNALGALRQLSMTVLSSTPADGSVVSSPPTDFIINFSEAYRLSSLDAGDLTVNGIAASTVTSTDADTATFHFASSPVSAQGLQTMSIAAGAVLRDGDGSGNAAWSASFRYDALVLAVTSTVPANGSVVSLPFGYLEINFNEAVAPGSIGVSDLTLSQGTVTSAVPVDADTVGYTLSGVTAEGTLTINLAAGALTDTWGNACAAYAGSFILDIGTVAYPTPLTAIDPDGSLIYDPSAAGAINPGADIDSFTINLDAGQTLTVLVDPGSTLLPTVEVRGPGGAVLGTASAPAAGKDAVLQTVPVATAGIYTITVASLGGTTGTYTVQATLNAALEAESHDGADNNTRLNSQNLDGGFIGLGGTASRGAVLGAVDLAAGALPNEVEPNNSTGQANLASANFATYTGNLYHMGIRGTVAPTGDLDWFNVGAMQVGDVITVSESGSGSSRGTLSDTYLYLYRYNSGSPVQVASSDDDGPGLDSLIYRFSVATADVYYVQAAAYADSYSGTYDLGLWLENAGTAPSTGGTLTSETEPNDSAGTANNASTSWRAVQYLSRTGASITTGDLDYYSFQFTAGDLVTVNIDSTSSLDARVWLLNGSGATIGLEDGASSGPSLDSPLYAFRIPTTGTYYVEVGASSGTGSYNADVYLSTATPPPMPGSADCYSLNLAAGASLTISTATPGDGPYEFVNTLDPAIELYDPSGTMIGSNDNGAPDGRNARLTFTAAATGLYVVRVLSSGGTLGEYVLTTTAGAPGATVAGRYVFYNGSAWDWNLAADTNGNSQYDPGEDGSDNDNAIAPAPSLSDPAEPAKELGKRALLPGQTATFVNYTSYGLGLNGIMVDVAGLTSPAGVDAADFVFRAGNSNDPSTWALAPVQPSVSVRPGAGAGGSDRITLVWPNNVIQKEWIQVRVLSNANGGSLGLAADDVFYFGNAIGETGDKFGNPLPDAKVNATDELGPRNHPHTILNPAPLYDAYDFNRDKKVNASDELVARNNQTTVLTALNLITAPAGLVQSLAREDAGSALATSRLVVSGPAAVQAEASAWAAQAPARPLAVGTSPATGVLVPSVFLAPGSLAPLSAHRGAALLQANSLPFMAVPAGQVVSSSPGPAGLEGLLVDVLSQARLTAPLRK